LGGGAVDDVVEDDVVDDDVDEDEVDVEDDDVVVPPPQLVTIVQVPVGPSCKEVVVQSHPR
jgi:hypothetical protein